MIMNILLSIMGQEILMSTDNHQIIQYLRDTYFGYISKEEHISTTYKKLDIDALIKNNPFIDSLAAVDNSIINLLNSNEQYYLLHAGLLLLDKQAFIICGKTKSGKSSACFLLQSLYDYACMSDDIVFINKSNLRASSFFRPIKLREPVVEKYNLKQDVVFFEHDSDGIKRYILSNHQVPNNIKQQDFSINAIIRIEYVHDNYNQVVEEIKGVSALQSLLLNSYTQDRLKNCYGVMTNLIRTSKVYQVRYNSPEYLNEILKNLSKIGVYCE